MKLTEKELQKEWIIVSAPSYAMHNIHKYVEWLGYTVGKAGWKADYYILDLSARILLAEGKAPLGAPLPEWILRKYAKLDDFENFREDLISFVRMEARRGKKSRCAALYYWNRA